MNKTELIKAISSEAKVAKKDVAKALDGWIYEVTKSLKKGEKVPLIGFGSFSVIKKKKRIGRNPKTGDMIKIPAKKVVKFRAGVGLKKNKAFKWRRQVKFINAISTDKNLNKLVTEKTLDALLNQTAKALKKGDRIALAGFGSFSVAKRAARNGRNPQTGKVIKIAAQKVTKFKAGADLASKVNNGGHDGGPKRSAN